MTDIYKMDTPAEQPTNVHHKREILLMLDMLNVYIEGFNLMGTINLQDDAQRILVPEITRSFHSLCCALRLSISGYYSQSISLLREITENWLISKSCKDNEKTRNCILTGEGKKPDFRKIAEELGIEKTIYDNQYRFESKFAHGSNLSLGILKEHQSNTIRVFPTYERDLFLTCTELFLKKALLMLQCMCDVLFSLDEGKVKEWDSLTGERVKKAVAWLSDLKSSP